MFSYEFNFILTILPIYIHPAGNVLPVVYLYVIIVSAVGQRCAIISLPIPLGSIVSLAKYFKPITVKNFQLCHLIKRKVKHVIPPVTIWRYPFRDEQSASATSKTCVITHPSAVVRVRVYSPASIIPA